MKVLVLVFLVSVVVAANANAQNVVQISTERDANGKFINWADLVVTWETEVVAEVPDHAATDNDPLQKWNVPVSIGWKSFSFTRAELGEYAVRWSEDGTQWSKPGVCKIEIPGTPVHED